MKFSCPELKTVRYSFPKNYEQVGIFATKMVCCVSLCRQGFKSSQKHLHHPFASFEDSEQLVACYSVPSPPAPCISSHQACVRLLVAEGSQSFRRLEFAHRILHDSHCGNPRCRFRVSLPFVVGQVGQERCKERRLALVAIVGLDAVVDRLVDMAAEARMVRTTPKVSSSCFAFQEDFDRVASVP